MLIHGKQRWQRQKRVAFEDRLKVRIAFSQSDLVIKYLGILVELRDSFREPERHPLGAKAKNEMRVFVVDGSIGPNSRRVWQDQNVILLGSGQEQANQVQLTLGQVGFRFEFLQSSLVLHRENEHRRGSIELRIRKHFLKYRTHSLKLPSHPAALLLA